MKPLVSIITPSYNQGDYIRETIESVLNQDYENIEYIIVDGGSTDNSLDIIKEYADKVIFISEKDDGQSDAINKGFRMSKGEIVAWLNSDDVYEKGCIRKAVAEFIKNEKISLLYGEGYIIDENSTKLRVFEHTQDFDYWKLVNFSDYIMQPTTFFKKEALEQVGFLDVELNYCMDWDLWIRLASLGEVKYIPDILACSREYEKTKTSTGGRNRLEEIKKVLRKYSNKTKPLGIQAYTASTNYIRHINSLYPIKKIMGLNLVLTHKRLIKKIPKKYENGMIGKDYSFLLPCYGKKTILKLICPYQLLGKQEVKILLNGVVYDKILFDEDYKEVNIEGDFSMCTEVRIVSKKTVFDGNKKIAVRLIEVLKE